MEQMWNITRVNISQRKRGGGANGEFIGAQWTSRELLGRRFEGGKQGGWASFWGERGKIMSLSLFIRSGSHRSFFPPYKTTKITWHRVGKKCYLFEIQPNVSLL